MANKLVITIIVDPVGYARETGEFSMTDGDGLIIAEEIKDTASFQPGFESITHEFKEVPHGRN